MARPLLGAPFRAVASHRLAREPARGPGRPSQPRALPRSGSADAPAPEEPRDQQDDDGADDRAQDPRRVQREERHGVQEHQVLQEAPTKEPTIPRPMVLSRLIGSRPGTTSRAMAPAINPTISRKMMNANI